MVIILMVIGGCSIGGYSKLLFDIILVHIGVFFYWWTLVFILLMDIGAY